jgi:hypothetical protein
LTRAERNGFQSHNGAIATQVKVRGAGEYE